MCSKTLLCGKLFYFPIQNQFHNGNGNVLLRYFKLRHFLPSVFADTHEQATNYVQFHSFEMTIWRR